MKGKLYFSEPSTLLLIAERHIENKDWVNALAVLNGILYDFPEYGPAHNHKGWILGFVVKDVEEAEKYFNLALKFDPHYPPTYVNYASLLNILEDYEKLQEVLSSSLSIKGIDKIKIHTEKGKMYERSQHFDKAIEEYSTAIRLSLQDDEILFLKNSIVRCKTKTEIFSAS